MINAKASNWVDRGEPPEPTLSRISASYLELEPAAHASQLLEYATTARGMAEADATEVQIAGYLRTLERQHLAAEHPARHRRAVAIALWHVTKASEVRGRALRLLEELPDVAPGAARRPLSEWLAERLLRDDPRTPE